MTRPPAPFVVGMGRSGTTLLRMMLDSHPDLAIPAETNFGPALAAFEDGGAAAAVEAIVGGELWDDYGLAAGELAGRVERRGADSAAAVLRAFFELYAESRGKPRWGNKTPYYLARMGLVQETFPEARFVHVLRDGRDVALSIVPLWFGADDVAGAAREWARGLRAARRQAGDVRFYAEVRYEDLVRDPEATLRSVCAFLELDWAPRMLDYHRDAAARLAAELAADVVERGTPIPAERRQQIHRLVSLPPQPQRVGRWRREMSAADRRAFEDVAAGTLREFGYEAG